MRYTFIIFILITSSATMVAGILKEIFDEEGLAYNFLDVKNKNYHIISSFKLVA